MPEHVIFIKQWRRIRVIEWWRQIIPKERQYTFKYGDFGQNGRPHMNHDGVIGMKRFLKDGRQLAVK